MEKVYSKTAINLYKSDTGNITNILNDLKVLYVDDENFRNYFALKQFNTNNSTDKKLARYTLFKIESQEEGGNSYDFETDNGTIEHILPESYPASWESEFTEEEFERNVYLLGNLTLLEPSKNNSEAADHPFELKKKVYLTSKYIITSKIDDAEWKPQNIRHRQAHLAKIATSIWRIQY